MIRERFFRTCVSFVFGLCSLIFIEERAAASGDGREFKDGKRLFLDVSIALSEDRFVDAHALAERLIRDYRIPSLMATSTAL